MYTPPPPLVYVISKNSSSSRRSFSVSATHVNDSGSIDSPLMQSMHNKIKEQLNADLVVVKDAYGDGRHVSIDVVSSAFEGQSAVNRQRMVYKAIWEELQNTVHAVDQMTTKTPTEAAATH
ncbi:Protein bola4 [Ranunculus cassubicifolius]